MKKITVLTLLLISGAAMAQSAPNSFDPKLLGSNPAILAATILTVTAFVKQRLPQLQGVAVVGISFGLSLLASAALFYTGNGATIGSLQGLVSWIAFGLLTGLLASGFKDLASSLIGLLSGGKTAPVIVVPAPISVVPTPVVSVVPAPVVSPSTPPQGGLQ